MWSILIVEDEAPVRTYLKNNIDWAAYGFRVIGEAGNGRSALELIEAARPDLVLCDIVMPIMSGIELLRRTREAGIESRFVMLTCMGEFEYARQALQYGASNYVLKLSMSVETLGDVLAGIDRELSRLVEQRSRHMLYEYQPLYQAMWEALTEQREQDEPFMLGIATTLSRALPNVALVAAMHGSAPFTMDHLWSLQAVKRDKHIVVHPFTALGHTTMFIWSPDDIELLPAHGGNAGIPAVRSSVVRSERLLQAWGFVLRQLDGRSKELRHVEAADIGEPGERATAGNIAERLEKYLRVAPREEPDTDHEEINKITQYIREHYDEPITLKSMAQFVAMDEHYVSSLFKKKTGENLIAYLHRVRVERARQLLLHSELSVSAVGERVGFASDNYFIKIFKRLAGATPADFRKAHANPQRG